MNKPLELNTTRRPAITAGLWWAGTAVVLLLVVADTWWQSIQGNYRLVPPFGVDFDLYRGAAARYLSGGGFYPTWQLVGPYPIWGVQLPILYPPTAIPLFAAFTVLPAFLWWAVPAGIILGVLRYHRTRLAPLAAIVALLAWPTSFVPIWVGNPVIWVVALLALATVNPAFAPWVLLKPSLAPFALWGVRDQRWLFGALALMAYAIGFLPLWAGYLTALRNSDGGLLYSLSNVPLMLVPVVAWLGRSR